jgi:hypothetical protein
MEKILLIDVDSKIPNIALMKLSTYYKNQGFEIELKKLGYDGYPHKRENCMVFAEKYCKVYVSIVFSQNKNVVNVLGCKDVNYGGSGYDLSIKLPKEVDDCEEDYNIYPENKNSYGFITRGCIRNCYFCFVPKKEGMIHKYRDIKDIVKHKVTMFLDNNILSYNKCEDILKELIDKKIRCQFNQGLDIRLLNDEKALLLSQLNYYGEYIFAFDNIKDEELIKTKLELFKKYIKKDWKVKFFIYTHPSMDIEKDLWYRVEWCKRNKVLPYIMRDQICWNDINREFYIDLSAYCNQPAHFKKSTFKEFLDKRHKNNKKRVEKSILIEKKVIIDDCKFFTKDIENIIMDKLHKSKSYDCDMDNTSKFIIYSTIEEVMKAIAVKLKKL